MPALAAHFRVVALDLRGFGGSSKPAAGYDLFTLAGDVAGAIEALGQEQAHVVGHDWGGVVAWTLATLHPQRLDRLAVLNAPHPVAFLRRMLRPRQLWRSWYMFFYQLPCLPEWCLRRNDFKWLERGIRTAAGRPDTPCDELVRYYKDALAEPGALAPPIAYYRTIPRMARQYLKRLDRGMTAPSLVIWGERDGALHPMLSEGLESWAPRVTRVLVPEAGHWPHHDAPDQVSTALLDFLGADTIAMVSGRAAAARVGT
jgi:pimeloyl-ACP methyl ester carboxylesterase